MLYIACHIALIFTWWSGLLKSVSMPSSPHHAAGSAVSLDQPTSSSSLASATASAAAVSGTKTAALKPAVTQASKLPGTAFGLSSLSFQRR